MRQKTPELARQRGYVTDLRERLTSCGIGTGPESSSHCSPGRSLTISQLNGRSTGYEFRPELKIPVLSLTSLVTRASY